MAKLTKAEQAEIKAFKQEAKAGRAELKSSGASKADLKAFDRAVNADTKAITTALKTTAGTQTVNQVVPNLTVQSSIAQSRAAAPASAVIPGSAAADLAALSAAPAPTPVPTTPAATAATTTAQGPATLATSPTSEGMTEKEIKKAERTITQQMKTAHSTIVKDLRAELKRSGNYTNQQINQLVKQTQSELNQALDAWKQGSRAPGLQEAPGFRAYTAEEMLARTPERDRQITYTAQQIYDALAPEEKAANPISVIEERIATGMINPTINLTTEMIQEAIDEGMLSNRAPFYSPSITLGAVPELATVMQRFNRGLDILDQYGIPQSIRRKKGDTTTTTGLSATQAYYLGEAMKNPEILADGVISKQELQGLGASSGIGQLSKFGTEFNRIFTDTELTAEDFTKRLKPLKDGKEVVPGYFTTKFGGAQAVLQEKEDGTFSLLSVTPIQVKTKSSGIGGVLGKVASIAGAIITPFNPLVGTALAASGTALGGGDFGDILKTAVLNYAGAKVGQFAGGKLGFGEGMTSFADDLSAARAFVSAPGAGLTSIGRAYAGMLKGIGSKLFSPTGTGGGLKLTPDQIEDFLPTPTGGGTLPTPTPGLPTSGFTLNPNQVEGFLPTPTGGGTLLPPPPPLPPGGFQIPSNVDDFFPFPGPGAGTTVTPSLPVDLSAFTPPPVPPEILVSGNPVIPTPVPGGGGTGGGGTGGGGTGGGGTGGGGGLTPPPPIPYSPNWASYQGTSSPMQYGLRPPIPINTQIPMPLIPYQQGPIRFFREGGEVSSPSSGGGEVYFDPDAGDWRVSGPGGTLGRAATPQEIATASPNRIQEAFLTQVDVPWTYIENGLDAGFARGVQEEQQRLVDLGLASRVLSPQEIYAAALKEQEARTAAALSMHEELFSALPRPITPYDRQPYINFMLGKNDAFLSESDMRTQGVLDQLEREAAYYSGGPWTGDTNPYWDYASNTQSREALTRDFGENFDTSFGQDRTPSTSFSRLPEAFRSLTPSSLGSSVASNIPANIALAGLINPAPTQTTSIPQPAVAPAPRPVPQPFNVSGVYNIPNIYNIPQPVIPLGAGLPELNLMRPQFFRDGGEVNIDDLVAPPIEVMPDEETESRRMLMDLARPRGERRGSGLTEEEATRGASQLKDVGRFIGDLTPGLGEYLAGQDMLDFLSQDRYGMAALSGVGLLPLVPPLAGVVKPKGGSWMGSATKAYDPAVQLQSLKTGDASVDKWIDTNLTNYVKKQMGSPDDPLRTLADTGRIPLEGETLAHARAIMSEPTSRSLIDKQIATQTGAPRTEMATTESGRMYEAFTDSLISADSAGEILDLAESGGRYHQKIVEENPWLSKVDPSTRVYSITDSPMGMSARMPGGGFVTDLPQSMNMQHMLDVLRNDVQTGRIRPEKLSQVSVADAYKRMFEFDEEMAKAAKKAELTRSRALLESAPEIAYETGFRWVKLPDPTSGKEAMDLVTDIGCRGGWCTQQPGLAESYGSKARGNELFVLIDENGRPHVQAMINTVEGEKSLREMKPWSNSWQSQKVLDELAKEPLYVERIKPYMDDFIVSKNLSHARDLDKTGLLSPENAPVQAIRRAYEELTGVPFDEFFRNHKDSKFAEQIVLDEYLNAREFRDQYSQKAKQELLNPAYPDIANAYRKKLEFADRVDELLKDYFPPRKMAVGGEVSSGDSDTEDFIRAAYNQFGLGEDDDRLPLGSHSFFMKQARSRGGAESPKEFIAKGFDMRGLEMPALGESTEDQESRPTDQSSARRALEEMLIRRELETRAMKDKLRGLRSETFGRPTLEAATLARPGGFKRSTFS